MQPSLLTMEQQFTLRTYQGQVKSIPREELENLFLEIVRQKMAQGNLFLAIMRGDRGMPTPEQLQQAISRKDEGLH